jgi:GNAT superfamily N-acetyltransferase
MLDLIANVRPTAYRNDHPVRADIEENLATSAIRLNTRIWLDNNQPVGWAYVDEFNNLWWELDRQYEERLGEEIVGWGESCIHKKLANKKAGALDASCRDDDGERISFLRRHGFSQTEETTVRMTRDLSLPIPEPGLPQGFAIRSIAGKQEAGRVARMHRAAFGTDYMTTEKRLAIMSTSEYDPSLDLIVVAPDGKIAANCICSVNEISRVGNTDPIMTHPRFQHLGLARALLLTGLRLLKERGMRSAHLGTSENNIAMQKTAESVEFTIEYKTIWFSKAVH